MKILSTEVISGLGDGWMVVGVILILLGVAGIVTCLVALTEGDFTVSMFGLFLALTSLGIVGLIDAEYGYEYEQHKVTITDINEVHEKGYEIIEQEGEIYTVQKKGADSQ